MVSPTVTVTTAKAAGLATCKVTTWSSLPTGQSLQTCAKVSHDIVHVEAVCRFVEDDFTVTANDEDPVGARLQRDRLESLAEGRQERALDIDRAREVSTRDAVFDFDRCHSRPFATLLQILLGLVPLSATREIARNYEIWLR